MAVLQRSMLCAAPHSSTYAADTAGGMRQCSRRVHDGAPCGTGGQYVGSPMIREISDLCCSGCGATPGSLATYARVRIQAWLGMNIASMAVSQAASDQ